MNYRQLGTSTLNVSEISFGCMSLEVNSPNNERILRAAVDAGMNYFDTADLYDRGFNEEIVGKALKPVRNDIILATKVGNKWRENGSGWDWNPRKTHILKAVEHSLRRLQTDVIDLYQLHGGTIDDPIDEVIEAFELLKVQGKIREYGISSIRPNVIREWVQKSDLVSVMMQYSLLDRRPEEQMLDYLQKNNISVLARGSLAKGLLINKPAKSYLDYSENKVKTLQQALRELGDPITLSLSFVLNHPAVASAVLGIRTEAQLDSVVSIEPSTLSPSIFKKINAILPKNYYTNHR